MLAIRMQRTGRRGHAQFRVVVQESRLNPSNGRVVARLGSYDPHTKATVLDKEKAATFLSNGAQPSNSVAILLKKEGVKLPDWVVIDTKKAGKLKNAEKLRANRPPEAKEAASEAAETAEAPTEVVEAPVETPADEATPEKSETEVTETPVEETLVEPAAESTETSSEQPAEEASTENPDKTEETA